MRDLMRSAREGRQQLAHSAATFPKRHPFLIAGCTLGVLFALLALSGISLVEVHSLKREVVRVLHGPCRKGVRPQTAPHHQAHQLPGGNSPPGPR